MDTAGGYLVTALREANEKVIRGAHCIQQMENENKVLKEDLAKARYLLNESRIFVTDQSVLDSIINFLGDMLVQSPCE